MASKYGIFLSMIALLALVCSVTGSATPQVTEEILEKPTYKPMSEAATEEKKGKPARMECGNFRFPHSWLEDPDKSWKALEETTDEWKCINCCIINGYILSDLKDDKCTCHDEELPPKEEEEASPFWAWALNYKSILNEEEDLNNGPSSEDEWLYDWLS